MSPRWIRLTIKMVAMGMSLVFLLVLASHAMLRWAQPNPNELAITPMAFDAASQKAAGILLNATKMEGNVTVLTVNILNGEETTHLVTYSSEPMQAIEYPTPAFDNADNLRTTLMFARPLRTPFSKRPD